MAGIYFYSSATNQLLKAVSEKLPKSTVTSQDDTTVLNTYGALDYPTDPNDLVDYINLSAEHRACIELKTRCISGNGFGFHSKENIDRIKEIEMNPNMNFSETLQVVLNSIVYNYIFFGNAYAEVIKSGDRFSIYSASPINTFATPNKEKTAIEKYVTIDTNTSSIIKEYTSLDITKEVKDNASYLVHFKENCGTSGYYGEPAYVSALTSILGNHIIDKWNINFFGNNARFDYAIIVSGGELTKENEEKMKEGLAAGHTGVANAHKSMIVGLPEGVKAEIHQLNDISDGKFFDMKNHFSRQIMAAHNVPNELLGMSTGGKSIGGNDAIGALKLFNETYLRQKQLEIETIMNKIFYIFMDINPQFKFKTVSVTDKKTEALIAEIAVQNGFASADYFSRTMYSDMSEEEYNSRKTSTEDTSSSDRDMHPDNFDRTDDEDNTLTTESDS